MIMSSSLLYENADDNCHHYDHHDHHNYDHHDQGWLFFISSLEYVNKTQLFGSTVSASAPSSACLICNNKTSQTQKRKVAQQLCAGKNYLPGPNPLWVLVDGTAPWRNSCLELSRISCSPATMETPSLQSLEMGSEGVEVTVIE